MKQRLTDIIKKYGENDGIVSRIYIDGKYNNLDILSVAWSYEDENLLVFLQDEYDTITETEWFDSLPYLTQIKICATIESRFGTEFDRDSKKPIKTNTDMEKLIKRDMLLEMIDYALKHDADGMRNLQNDVLLSWSGCVYDTIETNDEDGLKRLFENYSTYEIVESVAGGDYNPNHPYATIHHGEFHTFKDVEDYFDREFVADFLMAKENYFNLNDFFCQSCGDKGYYDYCNIFIKHYLRFNKETTERKVRNAVVDVFDCLNNFLYFSWNELKDMVRSSTKEDVFDDMRTLLKDRDKIIWFPANDCVLHQYYYGEIVPMTIMSVRLVKDLQGHDIILQDADYCEDGSPCVERVIDNVMHLSFKEMQELYKLMEKNNY